MLLERISGAADEKCIERVETLLKPGEKQRWGCFFPSVLMWFEVLGSDAVSDPLLYLFIPEAAKHTQQKTHQSKTQIAKR